MPFLSPRHSDLLLLSLAAFSLTSTVNAEVSHSAKNPSTTKEEWTYVPWKPTRENTVTPPTNLLYAIRDISGVWEFSMLFQASTIKVFPMSTGKYRILFSTTMCTALFTAERTGTYKEGVLLLDHPLSTDAPGETGYRRLFTIQTSQGIRLISDRELYFYLKKDFSHSPPFFAFEKRESLKASSNSK